jgi:hypothetical protein
VKQFHCFTAYCLLLVPIVGVTKEGSAQHMSQMTEKDKQDLDLET